MPKRANRILALVLVLSAKLRETQAVQYRDSRKSQIEKLINPSTDYITSVQRSNLLGGTFLRNFVFRVDLATHQIHLSQMTSITVIASAKSSVAH